MRRLLASVTGHDISRAMVGLCVIMLLIWFIVMIGGVTVRSAMETYRVIRMEDCKCPILP